MLRARTTAVLIALTLCPGCGGAAPPVDPDRDVPLDPRVAQAEGLLPTAIGKGPEYVPRARPPAHCASGPVQGRFRAHLELFGRRHAVVIPAGIGVRAPFESESGRIVGRACRADARTLDPAGVIDFDRADLTLGALFDAWGEPLSATRMAAFHGRVTAFVAGRRVGGDPGDIPLRDGAQIVLEVGGHIPPHKQFHFPPRPRGTTP